MQKQKKRGKKEKKERKREKKKKRKKWKCKLKPTQAALDPGRNATQAAWDPGLSHCNPCFYFWVFFFFFSDEHIFSELLLSLWFSLLLRWEGVKAKIFSLYCKCNIDVNRVLETWFTSGRHVEKVSTQTRSKHENWPSKTRFIV